MHAAVFHQFARQQKQDLARKYISTVVVRSQYVQDLRLVARARQLSCFVLVVGKIISSDAWRCDVQGKHHMPSRHTTWRIPISFTLQNSLGSCEQLQVRSCDLCRCEQVDEVFDVWLIYFLQMIGMFKQ